MVSFQVIWTGNSSAMSLVFFFFHCLFIIGCSVLFVGLLMVVFSFFVGWHWFAVALFPCHLLLCFCVLVYVGVSLSKLCKICKMKDIFQRLSMCWILFSTQTLEWQFEPVLNFRQENISLRLCCQDVQLLFGLLVLLVSWEEGKWEQWLVPSFWNFIQGNQKERPFLHLLSDRVQLALPLLFLHQVIHGLLEDTSKHILGCREEQHDL